ncbi:GTP-binding protein [Hoyosella rhizosphaerae]|uniref:Cobalamin synthesis protein n=1 Tax=Hoyosella rhizosphaerae TaxID=1755582 RepID=A0A916UCK8_9ACTN|nr:GTP-binding protein [Hoyosella rhizosphaerae]MBN4925791.1 GTP-binding protein [Hoyosella rhizosphaerae]GGC67912.1 putative cobalamin synthesis protein [Hoyosella rhizosphaerae]
MTIVTDKGFPVIDQRTPVVLVCGWQEDASLLARSFQREGVSIVSHDLNEVTSGVVQRTLISTSGLTPRERTTILALAHGCVSSTLREELLPLLRRLASRSRVDRIVLLLDARIDPEVLSSALATMEVSNLNGAAPALASGDVRIEAVISCVNAESWFRDATSEDSLSDRGYRSLAEDERTVADIAIKAVEFADALVVVGNTKDGWANAQLLASLARLAPTAPTLWADDDALIDVDRLLFSIPSGARRGEISSAHSPLLAGQPPLDADCGVQIVEYATRLPFHPQRLHDCLEIFFDGIICARGRFWVASQPDQVLWLDAAGGAVRVSAAGKWLAAMSEREAEGECGERTAFAALRWDDRFADRDCSLMILVHGADPQRIRDTLDSAVLSGAELALQEKVWKTWNDPFGSWHEDPCDDHSDSDAQGAIDITIWKEGH